MVLLPLHLTAFLLLYLGAMRIVRGEILRTHTHDAHVILDEALRDLHPIMVSHDASVARKSLDVFMASHELLDLRLYDSSGVLVGDRGRGGAADAEVVAFLASG
jgi:hypothetical protein